MHYKPILLVNVSSPGGGKTLVAIMDAVKRFEVSSPRTIVVVCPRILLVEQLSNDFLEQVTNANVLHVHSGETKLISELQRLIVSNCLLICVRQCVSMLSSSPHITLLHRIVDADIDVDTIYFDEAHNSVQRNFHESVKYFSRRADRLLLFHSNTQDLGDYQETRNE